MEEKNKSYREWFLTIPLKPYFDNKLIKDVQEFESKYLNIKYERFAYICHNHDVNNIHYHLILSDKNKIRFTTLKNRYPFGKIEKANNIQACISYFQHLSKPEDPYSKEEIKANFDIDLINFSTEEDSIFQDLESSENFWEFMKKHKNRWRDIRQLESLFILCKHYTGKKFDNFEEENFTPCTFQKK